MNDPARANPKNPSVPPVPLHREAGERYVVEMIGCDPVIVWARSYEEAVAEFEAWCIAHGVERRSACFMASPGVSEDE